MSTISTEERREVARRLRELPDDAAYPDLIGSIADHDGWYAAADAADRLADLIEPTTGDYDEGYRAGLQKARDMCDREALLELADEMEEGAVTYLVSTQYVLDSYARRIREACGEVVA